MFHPLRFNLMMQMNKMFLAYIPLDCHIILDILTATRKYLEPGRWDFLGPWSSTQAQNLHSQPEAIACHVDACA